MKVWEMTNVTNEHFSLMLKERSNENHEYLRDKLNGLDISRLWNPLEVVLHSKSKKYTDFPIFWDEQAPVFSDKAVKYSNEILRDKVEFLPLKHEKYNFFICNIINVIDCLEEDSSKIKRFSSGRILEIKGYDFNVESVRDQIIFKIPQQIHKCFVTELFKNHIESSKLKGYVFKEVWDSDEGWLYKEQIMKDLVEKVNSQAGSRFNYNEAVIQVSSGHKLVGSHFALKKSEQGIVFGKLQTDGAYLWNTPAYCPPIFYEIEWVINDDVQ